MHPKQERRARSANKWRRDVIFLGEEDSSTIKRIKNGNRFNQLEIENSILVLLLVRICTSTRNASIFLPSESESPPPFTCNATLLSFNRLFDGRENFGIENRYRSSSNLVSADLDSIDRRFLKNFVGTRRKKLNTFETFFNVIIRKKKSLFRVVDVLNKIE